MDTSSNADQDMIVVASRAPALRLLKPKISKQVTFVEKGEISKAIAKMDKMQAQGLTGIITQNCAQYRDVKELEMDIDDIPNDVQVMLLEYVRGIFGMPNEQSDIGTSSNLLLMATADKNATHESQGSVLPNTSASKSIGATGGASHALPPATWLTAPLPRLRDRPANSEGGSIDFRAGGRTFTALASILPNGNPYTKGLGNVKKRTVELSEDAQTVSCYFDALYNQQLVVQVRGIRQQDFDQFINLYSLGEKMNDLIFQDVVMDALRDRLYREDFSSADPRSFLPDRERILHAYGSTRHNSKLRLLIVDLYVCFSRSGCHPGPLLKPYGEFLTDFGQRFKECTEDVQKFILMKQAFMDTWPWPYFHSIDGYKRVQE